MNSLIRPEHFDDRGLLNTSALPTDDDERTNQPWWNGRPFYRIQVRITACQLGLIVLIAYACQLVEGLLQLAPMRKGRSANNRYPGGEQGTCHIDGRVDTAVR